MYTIHYYTHTMLCAILYLSYLMYVYNNTIYVCTTHTTTTLLIYPSTIAMYYTAQLLHNVL
jgi:hypothetical protein